MTAVLMGLVGEGVRPSLTPPMLEAEGAAQGLTFVDRPIDLLELSLPGTEIGRLLRAGAELGFDAFNVTHPCKRLALAELDEVDPAAARLGAVNTVLVRDGRLVGRNTDRSGFASAMRDSLPDAALANVVQLGAGGAGGAVADALAGIGVRRLTVVDPDRAAAEALAARVREAHPSVEVRAAASDDADVCVATADGLVNCSPVGMFTHPGMPIDASALHPALWVADIVYRPLRTALVDAAAELGCRVMTGGAMAVGQAADTFELVTGRTADRVRMRASFEALLAAETADALVAPVPGAGRA